MTRVVRSDDMKLTIATILALLILWLNTAHSGTKWNYQLSDRTMFENEIDSHYCETLIIQNQFIGWVTGIAEVGPSLVFRICLKEKPPFEGAASQGAIYGGVDTGWYELRTKDKLKPQKLSLPKLSYFSNPTYCKSYIAYWGHEKDDSYYAIVYHLGKRQLIKEDVVGHSNLETDYMYALEPPKWSNGCTSIEFSDAHFEKTVHFKW